MHPLDFLKDVIGLDFPEGQEFLAGLIDIPHDNFFIIGTGGNDVPVDIVPAEPVAFSLMSE